MNLSDMFQVEKPVIGMVHLQPLPGAPAFEGDLEAVRKRMKQDAEKLVAGGVDGLIIENFGDSPFYPDSVPKHVVAHMTQLTSELVSSCNLPVGINVLRNDAEAALSVAAATGADFIRVNVHTGARLTDQGIVSGKAHETVRLREEIAPSVKIFADVAVKHSARIGDGRFADDFRNVVERGQADAIIVSGASTGSEVDRNQLKQAKELKGEFNPKPPILVGSGARIANVDTLLELADGVIVGTSFKQDGVTTSPVNQEKVKQFMTEVADLR